MGPDERHWTRARVVPDGVRLAGLPFVVRAVVSAGRNRQAVKRRRSRWNFDGAQATRAAGFAIAGSGSGPAPGSRPGGGARCRIHPQARRGRRGAPRR